MTEVLAYLSQEVNQYDHQQSDHAGASSQVFNVQSGSNGSLSPALFWYRLHRLCLRNTQALTNVRKFQTSLYGHSCCSASCSDHQREE